MKSTTLLRNLTNLAQILVDFFSAFCLISFITVMYYCQLQQSKNSNHGCKIMIFLLD